MASEGRRRPIFVLAKRRRGKIGSSPADPIAFRSALLFNLSPEVLDYFKELGAETGLPYQKLIDLYLLDCAKHCRKLSLKWVA
jgi:hypothetical protein